MCNVIRENRTVNILLFASVGYYIKGADIAIRGINMARKEYKLPINLVVVVMTERQKEILERIKAECGGVIPKWIIPIGTRKDVSSLYHSADVYLNASRSEGFCYSIVEAVYSGCQVIQSDIPQNPHDIPGTYTFKSENSDSLKVEIKKFYDDFQSPEYKATVDKQRLYVKEHYGLQEWTSKCYQVLCEFARESK